MGTGILSSFKKSKTTHISNHIHEWRRRCHLIKLDLPDLLLEEWFKKSFVNDIYKDISIGGVVTKEQAIIRAQYLDLVYSQMGTLYDILPDAPRPSTMTTSMTPAASHAIDGVIGTFHTQPQFSQTSHTIPKSHASNAQIAPTPTPPTSKTLEVNVVQLNPTSKNKSKKGKGRNKEDKNNNPQSDNTKTQPDEDKDKHKPHYPFLFCGDDHYTKDCSRCAEVTKFLQGNPKPPTPVVLSQPFPSQQQPQLVIHDQPPSSTTSYVLMCNGDSKKNDITLTTRAKDYPSSKEKVDDIPPSLVQQSPLAPPSNSPIHLEQVNLNTILRPPPKGVV
jgi:hypothetical protein